MTTPAGTVGRTSVRRNNFDLIRLVAASQVVLFHGLEHLGLDGATHSVFGEPHLNFTLALAGYPASAECLFSR